MSLSGFVNLNKTGDMTSSDAVVISRGVLRSTLKTKNVKVGHLGALDPLGTGVLVLTVGKATKLFDYMLSKKKRYKAGYKFNYSSDTLDSAGKIFKTDNPVSIDREKLEKASEKFLGKYMQVPPAYSAKSIGGQRAYDLARKGEDFTLNAKEVEIFSLEVGDKISEDCYEFIIECGSGTYIRSLVRDIAEEIGTIGYMTYIRRTDVGVFSLENAVTLDIFRQDPLSCVLPIETAFPDMEKVVLDEKQSFKFRNGTDVVFEKKDGDFLLYDYSNDLLAIASVENNVIAPKVRLYEN